MKNTFGNNVAVTLFGESHGEAIGAVIDGLPAGIKIDTDFIDLQLLKRRPKGEISTARRENDNYKILSGVFDGKTCGTPICIVIPNADTKSKDYTSSYGIARPGHADYAAHIRYNGCNDYRGGGHFSGRITAALVAVGAIALKTLENKGIFIASHINSIGSVNDKSYSSNIENEVQTLYGSKNTVIDNSVLEKMNTEILNAKSNSDSVGGTVETAVVGMPAGVGEPWFDSIESMLSHAVFSVPAVKGIEFGAGFNFANKLGSMANDELLSSEGNISFYSNNNGGINGGITNGMPIVFKTVIKPTPSIAKEQKSVNFITKENVVSVIQGRHDPCIVHRAVPVLDCITALVICDCLATRFGCDYLRD